MTRLTHLGHRLAAQRSAIRTQQQHSCSFDHLVGAGEERGRHGQAERLGGFLIDERLDFGLHRLIWRGPAENRCRLSPRKIDAYSGMREA
jgi:hypothetical protein